MKNIDELEIQSLQKRLNAVDRVLIAQQAQLENHHNMIKEVSGVLKEVVNQLATLAQLIQEAPEYLDALKALKERQ